MMTLQNINLITVSRLSHTWLIDLDGTVLRHNGHLSGCDSLLPGVLEFWSNIPDDDFIIILTARSNQYRDETIKFLNSSRIRYDEIIFDLPKGERLLINDRKLKGLNTAIALNIIRDEGLQSYLISIDANI